MTPDVKNSIRFKSQLIKTYLSAMFPKSFFKITVADCLDGKSFWLKRRYFNSGVVINFTYLNKMFSGHFIIDGKNYEKDLEDYTTDEGVKMTDIKSICTSRNDICKMFATPSKLTLSGVDGLTITRKYTHLHIKGKIATISCDTPKDYRRILYQSDLISKVPLQSPDVLNESEKIMIKKIFENYEMVRDNIKNREAELHNNIRLDAANVIKTNLQIIMIIKFLTYLFKNLSKAASWCSKIQDDSPKFLELGLWDEYWHQLWLRKPLRNCLRVGFDKIDDLFNWIIFKLYQLECFFRPKNIIKIDVLKPTMIFSFSSDIVKTILFLFEKSYLESGLMEAMRDNPDDWKDPKALEVVELYNWYIENKAEIIKEWDSTVHLPKALRVIELKDYIG